MSDGGAGGGDGRGGRLGPWLLIGLGMLLVIALAGSGNPEGGPLDPRGTGEEGARGLVLLLEDLGADVELGGALTGNDTDVALLLDDRLDADQRADLRSWVREGGVLVVADPFSSLAPFFDVSVTDDPGARGVCDIGALANVSRLEADVVFYTYQVPDGAASCFGDGDSAFVVAEELGSGTVVSLGSPEFLLNASLDDADHAVLAADLLAPVPGTKVVFVERLVGSGDRTLLDLVGDNVWLFIVQLGVAFVVLAFWQGRRLGRPVEEPQPVRIAGAELTEAVARLLERSGSPERAARLLRADLHRRLTTRLGAPVGMSPQALSEVVASRTGVDATQVYAVLAQSPIATDDDLVHLATQAARLRAAVDGGTNLQPTDDLREVATP